MFSPSLLLKEKTGEKRRITPKFPLESSVFMYFLQYALHVSEIPPHLHVCVLLFLPENNPEGLSLSVLSPEFAVHAGEQSMRCRGS